MAKKISHELELTKPSQYQAGIASSKEKPNEKIRSVPSNARYLSNYNLKPTNLLPETCLLQGVRTTKKPPSRVAFTIVLVMLFALANDDPATLCCNLLPCSFIVLDGCQRKSLKFLDVILSS